MRPRIRFPMWPHPAIYVMGILTGIFAATAFFTNDVVHGLAAVLMAMLWSIAQDP